MVEAFRTEAANVLLRPAFCEWTKTVVWSIETKQPNLPVWMTTWARSKYSMAKIFEHTGHSKFFSNMLPLLMPCVAKCFFNVECNVNARLQISQTNLENCDTSSKLWAVPHWCFNFHSPFVTSMNSHMTCQIRRRTELFLANAATIIPFPRMRHHMHLYTIRILERWIAQFAFECPFQFVIFDVIFEIRSDSFVTNGTLLRLFIFGKFFTSVDFQVSFERVRTVKQFTANFAWIRLHGQFSFRVVGQHVFSSGRRLGECFTTHLTFVGLFTWEWIDMCCW